MLASDISFEPSPDEQEMLEHVNRMRMDPQGELDVLFMSTNPADPNFMVAYDDEIRMAMDFFHVDKQELFDQWQTLSPAPPLAFSDGLYAAATTHNERMILQDMQSHNLPADANLDLLAESSLSVRVADAGYQWNSGFALAENIYAFANSVLFGHAGFVVDWGDTPTGIQTPAGHRVNIMNPTYREVGISVIFEENPNTEVGQYVITQDFGFRDTYGSPRVLGVIYTEFVGNQLFDAGEGEAGVTIELTNGASTYTTVTSFAGGYQMQVPAGTYSAIAYGGNVAGTIDLGTVVVGSQNVKVDAETTTANYLPEGGTISGIVWEDTDEDGVRDAGEAGMSGWIVYLDADNDGQRDLEEFSAETDIAGAFMMTAVTAGNYQLRYEGQARHRVTSGQAFHDVIVEDGGELTGLNFGQFNYIQLNGNTATIFGTAANDTVTWSAANANNHSITVNGTTEQISRSTYTTLVFTDKGGTDTLNWTGGSQDDTAVVRPSFATMTSSGYSASGTGFETIYVDGGAGNNTRANLFDASSDDTYVGRATFARLTGPGFFNEVTNFKKTYGYATSGGNDRANLYDGATDDLFYGQANYSVLRGPNFEFYNYAQGWDKVYAYATGGGTDQAFMYDSASDDVYYGLETYSVLRGPNYEFYNYAKSFENVQAYANNGGDDTAVLYDSAGDDRFYAYSTYAYLRGPNSEFFNQANNFDQVFAEASNGGSDYAYMYDSSAVDIFQGYTTHSVMRGPEDVYYNQADDFDRVYATSINGGVDLAYLYGSEVDDRYFGYSDRSILRGANYEYYNSVSNFPKVYAYAGAGGTDISYFYDSANDDRFFSTSTYNVMRDVDYNYYNYAAGFNIVRATASNGGNDFVYLHDSSATDTLFGRDNYIHLTASGRDDRSTGFDRVIAISDDGGSDTKDLASLDYVFVGYGVWA
jgi:hypothetical protein